MDIATEEFSHLEIVGATITMLLDGINGESNGDSMRGPWNQGQGPWEQGEHWVYVEDPIRQAIETHGQMDQPIEGASKTADEVDRLNRQLSRQRSQEVKEAVPTGENQWSKYPSHVS